MSIFKRGDLITNTLQSRRVAEQILYLRQDINTTLLQIIKLVYLCHGWMLGNFGKRLIYEPIEAWKYGPVVPSVYERYKTTSGKPITRLVVDRARHFNETEIGLIKLVVEEYKDYSAWDLSSVTHLPGTPWYEVYQDGRGLWSVIPNDLIEGYYKALLEADDH